MSSIDKNRDLKKDILTAIENCKHPCDGICERCWLDDVRFNFGFPYCQSIYKEELMKYIQKHLVKTE